MGGTETRRRSNEGNGGGVDALILGAGPAGLVAAQGCAAAGLRTVLVERKREIGSPIQTSGATYIPEILRYGVPAPLVHRVERILFLSPGAEASFRNLADGIGVLDVRGMLQHLAEQAARRGVRFLMGTRALEPVVRARAVEGVLVQTSHGARETIRARVTIDATGLASVTARKFLGFPGFRRYGVGLEYDLCAPSWPQEDFVLLVGSRVAPTGYGWIFPWGRCRVRVGVGVTYPDARKVDLKACLERLIGEDERFGPKLRGAGCLEIHRGFIPSENFPGRPVADGLIAIGDAAGQASALAGEGIRFAMEMGELAGRAAVQALSRGGPSKERLARAHQEWERRHGRDFRIAMEINRRMASFSDAQWDKAVRYLTRLTDRQFLQFLKTDFTLSLFLRIVARNPDLAGKELVRRVLREMRKGRGSSGMR